MAANTPDRPEEPDHDRHESPLGPVEPIDAFDDGLILTDDGLAAPPGVPLEEGQPGEGEEDIPLAAPVDESVPVAGLAGGPVPDPDAAVGGPTAPTAPASGWLDSAAPIQADPPREQSQSQSTADIDLPPVRRVGEEPSDIFSTARRFGGSDVLGSGTAGDLADTSKVSGGSDVSAGPPSDVTGASVFDEDFIPPAEDQIAFDGGEGAAVNPEVSGRIRIEDDDLGGDFVSTDPNISLPGDPSSLSGFNRVDPENSGSDLFGDATVVDVNLLAEAGATGVDLTDPDAGPDDDPESMSSIFSRPGYQPSDGGRVDMDAIPLIGGAEERTESMFHQPEPGPASNIFTGAEDPDQPSVVSFDVPGPRGSQDALGGVQDSARIDWSEPSAADDPADVLPGGASNPFGGGDVTAADLAMDVMDDGSGPKAALDDESVFSMPSPKAIADPGLSAVLSGAAAAAQANPPPAPAPTTSRKGISLTGKHRPPTADDVAAARRPAPLLVPKPERKARGRVLVGALGVLVGAGAGAAGTYLASGGGGDGPARQTAVAPPVVRQE